MESPAMIVVWEELFSSLCSKILTLCSVSTVILRSIGSYLFRRIGVDETGPPTEGTGHKPGWYTNPEVTRFVDDEEEASNCQKWSGIEVKARETLGLRY